MRNFVIGTAGHVDHGKTSIVECLSGHNTDTLPDEQSQGITIQLGFTSFELDGHEVSIIDVPGHEKFVNHMVCGVHGFDLFMIVIAADDGVMPQTIEHLQIIQLLGVDKCICVINKCDIVDDEWLQLIKTETEATLSKYGIKPLDIVCVSAKTGQGIDNLKSSLSYIVKIISKEKTIENKIPRLCIDRLFSIKGHGTIVAGTLKDGILKQSDKIQVYPGSIDAKIRSMQSHGKKIDKAYPGMRLAVNLTGADKSVLAKGDVLTLTGKGNCSNIVSVSLNVLDDYNRKIKNNTRIRFFCGSSDVVGRIRLLDSEEVASGSSTFAQIVLEKEICCCADDKYVIRLYSPLETIGGGKIITLDKTRTKRYNHKALLELQSICDGDVTSIIAAECKGKSGFVSINQVLKSFNSGSKLNEVLSKIEQNDELDVFNINDEYWCADKAYLEYLQQNVLNEIEQYHNDYPYKSGLKYLSLVQNPKFNDVAHFDIFVKHLQTIDKIVIDDALVKIPEFVVKIDDTYTSIENALISLINKNKFCVYKLNFDDFADEHKAVINDVIDDLLKNNKVVQVADNCYLTPELIDEIKKKIAEFSNDNNHNILQISDFRDLFDISRKYAKIIMEYLCEQRVLQREGNSTNFIYLG